MNDDFIKNMPSIFKKINNNELILMNINVLKNMSLRFLK
jgi:hypothetical protein